jgi:hypothetical protein
LEHTAISLKPEKHLDGSHPDTEPGIEPGSPPSAPEKGSVIHVVLPVKRQQEVTFSFKPPAWDNLAASANRLLKFEFPVLRDIKVYERLIKTNAVSAGLSKKMLDTLSLPSLETIYRHLWQSGLAQPEASPFNAWLALFLLVEDLDEFDGAQLLIHDIEQLGLRDTGAMHSYYYRGPLNRENMITFLTGHGYRTDLLETLGAPEPESDADLQLAYFACRRLSHPLPWAELLARLSGSDLAKFPRLGRLQAVQALLQKQVWIRTPLTGQTLPAMAAQLRQLLQTEAMADISARYQLPRPVRELVIVEGETEKLLLPLFAQAIGLDFHRLGIEVLPAGGKNHVLSLYKTHAQTLSIPICVILDSDAAEIAQELQGYRRDQDCIFQIEEGEFEDLYDLGLTLKTINRHYQPFPEVTPSRYQELATAQNARGRVQALKALWQAYNLGSFDKIEFAGKYADTFTPPHKNKVYPQPPEAIRKLLNAIMAIHTGKG